MEKITWRTQIFSGFFRVCIVLLVALQICAILGFLGLSDSLGNGWPLQLVVFIIVVGIIFGNTRKEPTADRQRYQDWLANDKIVSQPTPINDQY